MNILFSLKGLLAGESGYEAWNFFGPFLYVLYGIAAIMLVIVIIQIIGISKVAKRNGISSPVLKAVFIPGYLLGELAYEHYDEKKNSAIKWVMLGATFLSLMYDSESTSSLNTIFSLSSTALVVLNICCYVKILDYEAGKTRIGTVILAIFSLTPFVLFAKRNTIPVAGTKGTTAAVNTNPVPEAVVNSENQSQTQPANTEAVKFCHNCGAQVSPDAQFCRSCGSELK